MRSRILPKLLDVEHLSNCVVRILGQNPGPKTLQGTNTYLVGSGPDVILIDTGVGKPQYKSLLSATLTSLKLRIVSIVLTHHHLDHVSGVPDVLDIIGECDNVSKFQHSTDLPIYTKLYDGDLLSVAGATLTVHYTPGHTDDSISLWLEEEKSLFCGDTILGGTSAVFDNYNMYLKTLNKYADLSPDRLYPGHGIVIDNAGEVIQHYIKHRKEREAAVLSCLRVTNGVINIKDLTLQVYKNESLNDTLFREAMKLVKLYLEKFTIDGTAVERGEDLWEKL